MPRTEPERKYKNQGENHEQNQEGRHERSRAENGHENVLHEELPEHAAVREKHLAGEARHSVGFESEEAREVEREERHADAEAEQAFAKVLERDKQAPEHEGKREEYDRKAAEYERERIGHDFPEEGSEPVAFRPAIHGTDASQEQNDAYGEQEPPENEPEKRVFSPICRFRATLRARFLLRFPFTICQNALLNIYLQKYRLTSFIII